MSSQGYGGVGEMAALRRGGRKSKNGHGRQDLERKPSVGRASRRLGAREYAEGVF